ncbi:squalene/phytoene synthase family protein [Acidocella sp. KAb 2-4]|uniref:squalene/phytoene synthase family protein n=1 Tax=Acidocella sp. KAb 2-4 TaxID=2885158 RepID=UPI001D099D0F|nr:squalene/phytoene synthase family protein [Acidocella sp. KAb 2-4]MCB5943415.1 squalene/phytoene synthase family protein [Acidocella sp. KAb 2-4]
MPPSSDSFLLRLRRADPDRYFCTLFAPAAQRDSLALLYLFNHELARAHEVASEPLLALIRLQWWREVVEGAERQHELATPLAAALRAGVFARDDLLALIEAREQETALLDADSFLAYARGTGGRLARIAGKWLGADSAVVEDLGTAYAVSGLLRATRLRPEDATPDETLAAQARALLAAQPPRPALAAALPAVFARRDLSRPYRARGLADRLAVLRAALTGRV